MDPPDSTEPNLNLSDLNDSEIFGLKPNMQFEICDDFFQDLFTLSNEHKESVVADQLENGDLKGDKMKSCPENFDSDEDLQPKAPDILEKEQNFHIIGQVSTMIEKLKQQNKEFKEKNFMQECELSQYEEKLSEKMNDLLKVQMERDCLKENLRIADEERSYLKLKVEEKEAELKQFKSLIQKQVTDEEEIQTLRKQMLNETKLLKKAEKDLQRATELLSKNRENLKLIKKRNKKLMVTIIEFGDILESKELLPPRRKKYLEVVRKKFKVEDENPIDYSSSEEENVKNNSSCEASNSYKKCVPDFNGLFIKKEETSSFSTGLPVDSNFDSNMCVDGFLHEVKSSPHSVLEEDISVNPSKSFKYITSSLVKDTLAPLSPVACKSEETSNDAPNEVVFLEKANYLSPDSNFQPSASGTDSVCSEDIEITDECFAKIKQGIEGWVLKRENYAPLSPLPPSPPPKSNSQSRNPQSEHVTNSDNSDKLTPISSVSTSVELLSESTEKNIVSDKSSPLRIRESDITDSSDQSIPFSIVPRFDQQNLNLNQEVPVSPESSVYIEKENGVVWGKRATSETESGVTEIATQVAQNSECTFNQEVTPVSPENIEKENEKVWNERKISESESGVTESTTQVAQNSESSSNQEVTPISPESPECIEKEVCDKSATLEIESGITESTTQVVQNSESSLNRQVTPVSPESSQYNEIENGEVCSKGTNSDLEKNWESVHFIPLSDETDKNTIPASPESSSACIHKKNIFSHQNSKGFEPHIEENSEILALNNSTVSKSLVSAPMIPPELHYLSSSYGENNSFKILHQGGSVYDYLVNPETKLSVCILTLTPKISSLGTETANLPNSAVKNANVLPREEERMKRVLSLYQATEQRVSLIKNQIIDPGSSHSANNPSVENLPRVCVVVESENDISINSVANTCSAENASDSGMDLDDTTFDDMQKDNPAVVKGQSDENQYLVSSSCDVSTPSKRKLTSSSFKYHGSIQHQLTNKKHCTKPLSPPVEFHQKDEIESNVSETINKKKRTSENIEDLSCKKIKIERQLPNIIDKKENFLPLDDNVSFSAKINDMSMEKSSLNLKCLPSNCPQLLDEKEAPLPPDYNVSFSAKINEISLEKSSSNLKCLPTESQLIDEKEIILPVDDNVSFSAEMLPEKSSLNLKCLPSESQLLSHKDCPELENENSPLNNGVLRKYNGTGLFSHITSPSETPLLFTANNMDLKNSSENSSLNLKCSPSESQQENEFKINNSDCSAVEDGNKSIKSGEECSLTISETGLFSHRNTPSKTPLYFGVNMMGLKNSSPEKSSLNLKCSPSESQLLSHKDYSQLENENSSLSNVFSRRFHGLFSHNISPPKIPDLFTVNKMGLKNPTEKEKNSKVSSPHDLRESSENQPTSKVDSSELKHSSPLKSKHISNSSPQEGQQNSHLNCVSTLGVNSPQMKVKNSPGKNEPLSEVNSHLFQCKNSPLKDQHISNANSPEKEQQNSQLNCVSILEDNSSPLELKNFPEKCQPLSEVNSLKCKSSPLKNHHVSNVNIPEQEQQNSQSNCVSILDVNGPDLNNENSSEKCQILSKVIRHQLECKNSLKNHKLSNIHTPQLELEISSFENQLSSEISNVEQSSKNQTSTANGTPTLDFENSPLKLQHLSNVHNSIPEVKDSLTKFHPITNVTSPPPALKTSPLQNKEIDSIRSPDLYLEENSLVIDEDAPQENELEINNSDCLTVEEGNKSIKSGDECSLTISETNHVAKKKKSSHKKKKKSAKSAKNKKKKSNYSIKEEPVSIVICIPKVLKLIEEVKIHDSFSESHFKRYAHTLLSAIINPSNAFSTSSVLYQICNHLRFSRTNPLMSFPIEYNTSVFFPLTERCIVSALIQAERKKKSHLEGLITATINNLYLLVLSKESISKTGLGAFCRVFTELCKNMQNRKKPIRLCCELIKTRHKFAPILIASIMGVWPELFAVTDETPDEEVMLQGSIAYGLEKKPPSLTSADWKQCKAVFSKYLSSSPVSDVDEATRNLIEILEEFLEETPRDDDYMMTDPLLMFAACNGWDWAQNNLCYFILPSLARYAQQKEDERAFSLFCNLYADISLLCPDFESCSEILEQLFILKEAFDYVKGCAARSMIKLYLLSKHKFPSCLYEWTQENESQLIGTPTELLLKQRLMSDVSSFSESDIIAI